VKIRLHLPLNTKHLCSRFWEEARNNTNPFHRHRCRRWIWCSWAGLLNYIILDRVHRHCFYEAGLVFFHKSAFLLSVTYSDLTVLPLTYRTTFLFNSFLVLALSSIHLPLPYAILFYSISLSAAPTATAPPCTPTAPKQWRTNNSKAQALM